VSWNLENVSVSWSYELELEPQNGARAVSWSLENPNASWSFENLGWS